MANGVVNGWRWAHTLSVHNELRLLVRRERTERVFVLSTSVREVELSDENVRSFTLFTLTPERCEELLTLPVSNRLRRTGGYWVQRPEENLMRVGCSTFNRRHLLAAVIHVLGGE